MSIDYYMHARTRAHTHISAHVRVHAHMFTYFPHEDFFLSPFDEFWRVNLAFLEFNLFTGFFFVD
jgi:hypothetical protein